MNDHRIRRGWILSCLCLLSLCSLQAQTVDRIIAIIGEEVILESDVDNQYNYMLINGQKDDGTLRCKVIESLIVNKLLLNKAEQDSIVVSEDEVMGEIDRRTSVILQQLDNNEAEFQKRYGKPLLQFREDLKPDIEDELLIQRQRGQISAEASITPREVKKFFRTIPLDSLGLFPAEVELNHIVVKPPYSEESIEKVLETLKNARRQALDGEADFASLAKKYSQGPSAPNGGSLGEFGRGMMVPQFEEVVYNMRVGEVSEPFETEFGYHVVYLQDRKGELITASHILMKPRPSVNGDSVAISKLKEIRELIDTDSLTFEQAAIRFSEDRSTKDCGGCITNPQSGELRVPMNALDAEMYFKVDEMQAGDISDPSEYLGPDRSRYFHILYLKTKIPPHTPNLKHDYKKIHDTALRAKQGESFEKWIESAKVNIYIDIKPTECSNALKNWVQ